MRVCLCVTDEVACVDPEVCQCICENPNGCSNIAYPLLVLRILSPGKVNHQGERSVTRGKGQSPGGKVNRLPFIEQRKSAKDNRQIKL